MAPDPDAAGRGGGVLRSPASAAREAGAPRPRASVARRLARWGVALAIVVAVAGGAIVWRSERILHGSHAVDPALLALRVDPGDPGLVERGRHVGIVLAQCTHCHGPDLSGSEMADDPWLGRLYASNLTSGEGGVGGRYARADWVRAIRYGVAPDGRSLLLMPAQHLVRMSDRDVAAVIDWLERVPAVDAVRPETVAGPLTRAVLALGLAPDLVTAGLVDRRSRPPVEVPEAPSAAYGEYLVALGSCRVCHREDLRGGLHPLSLPGEPLPPDLRPGGAMAGWSRGDFARAMRRGRTPDGRELDPAFMPWPRFAGLRDVEIDAMWRYLGSLGEEGARR